MTQSRSVKMGILKVSTGGQKSFCMSITSNAEVVGSKGDIVDDGDDDDGSDDADVDPPPNRRILEHKERKQSFANLD